MLLGLLPTSAHIYPHMWSNPRLFCTSALLSCPPIYHHYHYYVSLLFPACKVQRKQEAQRGHHIVQIGQQTAQRGQLMSGAFTLAHHGAGSI